MTARDWTTSMSPTVLVADDDEALRRTIVDYLRAEGLDIVEAEHGLQALLHGRAYGCRRMSLRSPTC